MTAFKGMSTNVYGCKRFMAPELLGGSPQEDFLLEEHGNKPTTFSDVYSFGAVFYHVMSDGCLFEILLTVFLYRSAVDNFLSRGFKTRRAERIQTSTLDLRKDLILTMCI
jgi:serine/threonine protein kinase